ncbi:MAG: tetratricopeptide repeat protein [Planctomycetota bacterium]
MTTHSVKTRSHSPLGPILALPLLLGALSTPAAAQDKDTIQLKDGTSDSGLVKSEEYGGVNWQPGKGAARTILWTEIAPNGITYASAPDFQSAREDFDKGALPEAMAKFDELLADSKLRGVLKQNAMFFKAMIHQRLGEYDQAIAGYKTLVADFPKSRWLMEIGENLVLSHVAKKDVPGAGKALDELSAAATSAGVEAGFNSSVNVLKGRLFEEQGKFPEAQAAYGVVATATGVPASVAQQARLGQARCFVALNKKSEAEAIFRKLAGEDAPNPVLAGAWNGIGDLMLEDARKGTPDAEKLLDVLYCYLRGTVQYTPLPGESRTEYKRACKSSAEVFKFISQVEKNKDRQRLYLQRATEREEQFKKEFPSG